MVVDDHTIVREGLTILLDAFPDLTLAGEAANGDDAIHLCAEVHPHVVLIDLVMPGMDGVTAIRHLRKTYPDLRILALTSFKEQNMVRDALQAGAIGYLLKDISAVELAEAIRAASRGKPTLSPDAAWALAQSVTQTPSGYGLTDRELAVLALIVKGLSNAQIAQQLEISVSTVKNHVSQILSKMGVASRTEAATRAIQQNLLDF